MSGERSPACAYVCTMSWQPLTWNNIRRKVHWAFLIGKLYFEKQVSGFPCVCSQASKSQILKTNWAAIKIYICMCSCFCNWNCPGMMCSASFMLRLIIVDKYLCWPNPTMFRRKTTLKKEKKEQARKKETGGLFQACQEHFGALGTSTPLLDWMLFVSSTEWFLLFPTTSFCCQQITCSLLILSVPWG